MESIRDNILSRKNNLNVDNKFTNNVYVDVNDIETINEACDKHKAIGLILAEKLNKQDNLKLYIKLSYLNPTHSLLEWASLATEAFNDGRAKDIGKYFYGIVRNLGKVK